MHKNVSNSEVAGIMQIIDPNDTDQNNRKNIFNEKFQYVGINCFAIDETVYCYYILFGIINKDYDEDDF